MMIGDMMPPKKSYIKIKNLDKIILQASMSSKSNYIKI